MPETTVPTVFDITSQQVAGTYAKAFVDAATTAHKIDAQVAELNSMLDDVLAQNPEFETLLGSSFVKHEEKIEILDRVFGGQASPEMLAFLKVTSAHGRLNSLRAIRSKVQDLYNQQQGRIEVTLTTPTRIDDALESEIIDKLRSMLGAEPKLKVVTDESLLGGLIVRVGDTVYDGSLKTRLSQLRTQMVSSTVQQIETSRQRFM